MRVLFFGTVFGFILSRAAVTEFDTIAKMFLFEDLHAAGVIGVAIVVAAPILKWLQVKELACAEGCDRVLKAKPEKSGLIVGSAIFGVGWALTGTCPGTGIAQLGEGKVVALFTVVGMLLGAGINQRVGQRLEAWLSGVRSARSEASS